MSEPRTPKVSAESVLRGRRRPVTRYRPWVIALLGGALLLAVGVGFMIGFREKPPGPAAEPPAAEAPTTPPEIDPRLPTAYDDPLAIRPAPAAEGQSTEGGESHEAPTPRAAPSPSPAAMQRDQERIAAQASGPFFGGVLGGRGPAPAPEAQGDAAAPSSTQAARNDLSPREAFIARAAGGANVVARLPTPPLSRFEIKAGTIISAALVTGLNSDLPGPVIAQVTEPVFDHLTGSRVLIPQGARLIGRYDSQVGAGQDRVLVVWTRIVFPDGVSLDIGAMTGGDVTGAGGLEDQVDTHVPRLARAIGLSTLISIGAAAAQNSLARGSDNLILQDGASGLAATASDTGKQIVERDLQRAPTLRVRPGWPLRLIVDKDLVFGP